MYTKQFNFYFVGLVYDINRRFILAVTTIGGHNATCESLAAYMDLPPPVTTYQKQISDINAVATTVALNSMKQAASEAEVHAKGKYNVYQLTVPVSAAGFASKNRILTVMTNIRRHESQQGNRY